MGRTKKTDGGEDNSVVKARLTALIRLFKSWVKTGIPAGVACPTSLNAARDWTNADYGILVGIGSKRDITTTHEAYGKTVLELASVLNELKTLKSAKVAKKRVYKTAKAKKVAAEDDRDDYKLRLEGVAKQLVEKEYELEQIDRDLKIARQRNDELRADNDKLVEKVGRLTRELSLKGGGLKVVD